MSSVAKQTVVRMKDFRASEVGDKVSKALNVVTGQISDGLQNWSSKARSAARSTDGFVRSSPWQAVGTVALAGLAAGALVSIGLRASRRPADVGTEPSSPISGG